MNNSRMLFGMLVFLVILNWARSALLITNDVFVIIFVLGMVFVCTSFMIMRSKKKMDQKYGKYRVDEVSDEIKELAKKTNEEIEAELAATDAAADKEDK